MRKFTVAIAAAALMAVPAWSQDTKPSPDAQAAPTGEAQAAKPESAGNEAQTPAAPAAPKPVVNEEAQPDSTGDKPAETPGAASSR
jgi:hypothetical protein